MTKLGRATHPILGIGCILIVALVFGLGGGYWFAETPYAGPVPTTLPLLKLMPESATAVIASPSVERVGDKMVAVLRRVVSTGGQDIAGTFLNYLGELAGTEAGHTMFMDALASVGFATDRPVAVYLRGGLEAIDPDSTSPLAAADVAFVFGTSDSELVRNWFNLLARLTGSEGVIEVGQDSSGGVQIFADDFGAFFLHDGWVGIATDAGFLEEIEAGFANPRAVAYGSKECPAYSEDAFAALARADGGTEVLQRLLAVLAGDTELATLVSGRFFEQRGLFGPDPGLVTFDWTDDSITLAARADLVAHEELRAVLGRPTPVRLARAVPEATLGLVSLRFNETSKSMMLDLFSGSFAGGGELGVDLGGNSGGNSGGGGMETNLVGALNQWIQFVDDELVLALTSLEGGTPRGVGLLAVRNRSVLTNVLMSLPVPGEYVETFHGADIKIMPGTDLHYTTARNTVIVGNKLAEVKEVLGNLRDKKTSRFFDSLDAPLDLDAPRYVTLLARSEVAAEAIARLIAVPDWGVILLNGAEVIVDDLRVTAGMTGTYFDARGVVKFTSKQVWGATEQGVS